MGTLVLSIYLLLCIAPHLFSSTYSILIRISGTKGLHTQHPVEKPFYLAKYEESATPSLM